MVKYLLLLLALPFAYACIPDWECTGWSSCGILGYNIRECTDANNCRAPDRPVEIKHCDDENTYEIAYEPEPSVQDDTAGALGDAYAPGDAETAHPNAYMGIGIIAFFAILGAVAGRLSS